MKKWIRKKKNRTGSEECQICNKPRVLVEHHIHGRKIDDFNASWNKCYICDNCHRDVHMGTVVIEDWVSTSDGLHLSWHYAGETGITGKDATVYLF